MKKLIFSFILVIGILSILASCANNGNTNSKEDESTSHNDIDSLSELVVEARDKVENLYQRLHDLIPNLVNTVKGYAAHESTTLQDVTDARTGNRNVLADTTELMNAAKQALNTSDANAYSNALSNLNRQFGIYVNAVLEAYPDLKAKEDFFDLQTLLEGIGNRLETAIFDYNVAVNIYNNEIKRSPENFPPRQPFNNIEGSTNMESSTKAPEVKF